MPRSACFLFKQNSYPLTECLPLVVPGSVFCLSEVLCVCVFFLFMLCFGLVIRLSVTQHYSQFVFLSVSLLKCLHVGLSSGFLCVCMCLSDYLYACRVFPCLLSLSLSSSVYYIPHLSSQRCYHVFISVPTITLLNSLPHEC